MLLVTGGAGFIGANFVVSSLAANGEAIVNLDKLTYAGNLKNLDALAGDAPPRIRAAATSATVALVRRLLAEHRPRAIVHFAAESHVDRSIEGPAEFIQTNVVGTLQPARGGARLVGCARRRREGALPLPARLDRRGLRLARADGAGIHRAASLRAEQPLCGVQGRLRPPGARLPPYLRPAGADHQLLEQLRPAPVPGEADPADDHARARGQAAAGLRRRPERARLALRARPLRGACALVLDKGRPGADLQYRRWQREDQPRRGEDAVRDAGRSAPARRAGATPT